MPTKTKNNAAVAAYYDYMVDFYRFWFIRPNTAALHYGFSEPDKHSFNDSLLNTNRYLARSAKVSKSDKVLDAGCGIGGSSLWLAESIGCETTGITISKQQVKKAITQSKIRNLDGKVTFLVADYTDSGLPANSFDVVWALESVCYAKDKLAFLREARRLLKPGGRLVIGDGYLLRQPQNTWEEEQLRRFQDGFVIPALLEASAFQLLLQEAGFTSIQKLDTTEKVQRSSRRMYYLCIPGFVVAKILEALHITSPILSKNNLSGIAQYRCVKAGLAGYFVFTAKK